MSSPKRISAQRGLSARAPWFLALWLACALSCPAALAQQANSDLSSSAFETQRRQQQDLDAQQSRTPGRPDILAPSAPPARSADPLQLPDESPCVSLRQVIWDGPAPPSILAYQAQAVVGRRVGAQGLRALQQRLMQQLAGSGLITSTVLVPEQSLADGVLTLRYVPGRISTVHGEGAPGWWRTVLPAWPGSAVNQRDLDQALENIRRLPGQADATIDVVPGAGLGESDIVPRIWPVRSAATLCSAMEGPPPSLTR